MFIEGKVPSRDSNSASVNQLQPRPCWASHLPFQICEKEAMILFSFV
jgi:hypothetical protein